MISRLCILLFGSSFLPSLVSQEITYADDIAGIIYQHCSTCHRSGEIAPFALTNYNEVSNWASTIKFVTENKLMPPWQPDPKYSRFLEENFLTDEQISDIAKWVDDGMPRGDISNEPAFPDFPPGSVLGEPDLVLEMSESYLHKGNNRDNYRYFVLPSGLDEDKVIKAMEFRPDNSQIVHHALIFEDVDGIAREKDNATAEYGFRGFGSFLDGNALSIIEQKQFPGYVPGQKPVLYPDGVGQILKKGADVVIQVHYAPWPVDQLDKSKLNIFFADETEQIEREVKGHIMVPLPSVVNDLFIIPGGAVKEFHGIWELPEKVSFISVGPHMHLLGQHWEVYLEHIDGRIEPLIKINNWDFNWQGGYAFPRYIVADQGARIHAIASYDNTTNNPNNPNNPPRAVTWGDGTTDEMFYLPLNYVPYQSGDENIVFNDLTTSVDDVFQEGFKLQLFPNPADDYTTIVFDLEQGESVDIVIFDFQGRVIRQVRKGEFFNTGSHSLRINTHHLSNGSYLVNVRGKRHNFLSTLVVAQ